MKVICPNTHIAPETRAALDHCGYPWESADVSGSDTAYTQLLQKLWRDGDTFALVEHDIVPWRGALAELAACPRDWCAFQYPFGGGMIAGLGCTRFRAALLAAHPAAVDDTLTEATEIHPTGFWCNLDDRLTRALTRRGAARHEHTPAVGHLFPYPTHGCC